jgi:FHA domain
MKAPASPPVTPAPDVDLDATAELPVLDAAALEEDEPNAASDAAHSVSDTWILPPGAGLAAIHSAGTAAPPLPAAGPPPAPRGAVPRGAELREPDANLQATLAKLRDADQLAARQAEELRGRKAAGAQQTADLEAATRARSLAEHRAASLEEELAQAREKSSILSEQVAQLQQRLTQHEVVSNGEFAREREQQQALTSQVQAHSAQLIQDLHVERARSASCLESLQTVESRRRIVESMTMELQREMDAWQHTEAELRSRLGSRDSRVRELETELDRRAARIADLEQQLSSLEARLAQQSTSEAQVREELQRLRTQRAELDVMLATERDATASAVAESAAREAALASERARNAQLEEALAVERQRVAELEKQRTASRQLQAERDANGARIEALEKANDHWRTTAAVGREASHQDSTHDDVLHLEPTADGVARLLIHSDGGREVVHVLGRKTSIGRTPDNDLQIDGRHISRHHAVILAGPATTLIEDLNSTNGVQVNGQRVVRHVLQDGDQVTIGRTLYRYVVRRTGEPR